MVRYYKNNSTDLTHSTSSIWRKWIVIGVMLMFGLMNANAQKCCYSISSALKQPPNIYQLNITASHVNSKKGNNKYTAAISFQDGYTIIGEPYSPFNKLSCDQVPGTGTITQYQCDSQDRAMFFVTFELSVRFLPQSNTSITASDVFIYGDKCQNVGFCTDLAAKNVADNTDKISLGPLGTWPKYAVVIGGVILGVSLLIACYFVYKRNRTDDRYRDRSITPGTGNYEDKRLFSPNSLLRDEDLPPPSVEPPKNTLIQFGSVTTHSPERSKSVRNQHQHQQSSLTKSPTRRKKDRDHQEIEIHDNIKSDGHGHGHVHGHGHGHSDKAPDVAINISGNDGSGGGYKTRRSKDRGGNNNNVNRMSDYSTSDMSKTISVNDNSDVGGDLSDNNNNENKHLSSTSIHRKKSKSSRSVNSGERESRRGDRKRSPNSINNNSNKSRRSSTSRGVEEDREGRRVDRATSRGRHSRKNSSSPSKNTSDLRKGPSVRKRQTDHDSAIKNKVSFSDKETGKNNNRLSRSDTNLDRRKSNKRRDSHGDAESDVPLGDKLPLAILAKQKSWKSDDDNVEDDDTTPLGRISSYSAGNTNSLGATSTSSHTHLMDASTSPEDNNYGSVLDEVLGVIQDDEKLSDVKEKNNEPDGEEVSIKR